MMKNTNDAAPFNSGANKRSRGSPARCPLPCKKRFMSTETMPTEALPVELMEDRTSQLSYTINGSPDSLQLLNSSTVSWNHIEITNCITAECPTWNFPSSLKTSLTSLTISECTFTWSWLVEVSQQFESLEKLTLRKCRLERKRNSLFRHAARVLDEVVHTVGPVPEVVQTSGFAMKRRLRIKLEMDSCVTTNAFLKLLNDSSAFSQAALEISIPGSENRKTPRILISTRRNCKLRLAQPRRKSD